MSKAETPDIVLVVDDSPDTLRMLTDAIEDAGKTVLVARGGTQALALVEKITPDVILMDAVMPGIDGFEACRRLKRNKALSHVPVIFMTGLSDTGDIIKGLEAGGVDYVTKPIAPAELLARIHVHLANARMTHSARAALDVFDRFLLAVDRRGRVLWSTPQADVLLAKALKDTETTNAALPVAIREWLVLRAAQQDANTQAEPFVLTDSALPMRLELLFVSTISSDEYLLRLVEAGEGKDENILKRKLTVTTREAEVLLWIARGKSNRDIAEILKLSPRTVNKHLEQIYVKLGVENRTSAAALAVRTIGTR